MRLNETDSFDLRDVLGLFAAILLIAGRVIIICRLIKRRPSANEKDN